MKTGPMLHSLFSLLPTFFFLTTTANADLEESMHVPGDQVGEQSTTEGTSRPITREVEVDVITDQQDRRPITRQVTVDVTTNQTARLNARQSLASALFNIDNSGPLDGRAERKKTVLEQALRAGLITDSERTTLQNDRKYSVLLGTRPPTAP